MIVNIAEAKAKLSHLINLVLNGEKVVIAKNNLPLVDLVPHKPKEKRALGLLPEKVEIPDDFIEEDTDVNAMFYGKNDEADSWISQI